MSKQYYVYMLTNSSNTVLYIGVTNNIIKRVWEHKNSAVDGFTSKYNTKKLIYFEILESAFEAISREKKLKNWHKEWKWNLIKEANPNFKDLYDDLL